MGKLETGGLAIGETGFFVGNAIRLCAIDILERCKSIRSSSENAFNIIEKFIKKTFSSSSAFSKLCETSFHSKKLNSLLSHLRRSQNSLDEVFKKSEDSQLYDNYIQIINETSQNLQTCFLSISSDSETILEVSKYLDADTSYNPQVKTKDQIPIEKFSESLKQVDDFFDFEIKANQVFHKIKNYIGKLSVKPEVTVIYHNLSRKISVLGTLKELNEIPQCNSLSDFLAELSSPKTSLSNKKIEKLCNRFVDVFNAALDDPSSRKILFSNKLLEKNEDAFHEDISQEIAPQQIEKEDWHADTASSPIDQDESLDNFMLKRPSFFSMEQEQKFFNLTKTKGYLESSFSSKRSKRNPVKTTELSQDKNSLREYHLEDKNERKDSTNINDQSENSPVIKVDLDLKNIPISKKDITSDPDINVDISLDTESPETFSNETLENLRDISLMLLKLRKPPSIDIRRLYQSILHLLHAIKASSEMLEYKNLNQTIIALESVFDYINKQNTFLDISAVEKLSSIIGIITSNIQKKQDTNMVQEAINLKHHIAKLLSSSSLPKPYIDNVLFQNPEVSRRTIYLGEEEPLLKKDPSFSSFDSEIKVNKASFDKLELMINNIFSSAKNLSENYKIFSEIFNAFEQHGNIFRSIQEDLYQHLVKIEDQQKAFLVPLPNENKQIFQSITGIKRSFRALRSQLKPYNTNIWKMRRADTAISMSISSISSLAYETNKSASQMKLVDLKNFLEQFHKKANDLAILEGKRISLKIRCANIYIGKSLSEKILEILSQLLKNAVSHGIEESVIRQKRGKPIEGEIVIRAYKKGSHLSLEVEDDGSGLNYRKIRENILKLNLLSQDALDELDDQETNSFIFKTGFSTSDARGEGLDLVKSIVTKLKGQVFIRSQRGKSFVLSMEIPLKLSASKILKVKVESFYYGIPLEHIKEVVELSNASIQKVNEKLILNFRGSSIEVIPLSRLIGIKNPKNYVGNNTSLCVVIFQIDKTSIGLIIDEMAGQETTTFSEDLKLFRSQSGIIGVTVLETGEPLPILGIETLLNKPVALNVHKEGYVSIDKNEEKEEAIDLGKAKLKILHLDDSSIITTFIKNMLSDMSINTISANTVRDALKILYSESYKPDLIITDIEINNEINGFDFIDEVRERLYKTIPIIILSARSSKLHQLTAKEKGNIIFIEKPVNKEKLTLAIRNAIR